MKKITLGIVAMLAILASAITGCVNPAQGDGAQKITIPVPQLSDISMSPGIIWSQQNVGIWVSGEGKVKANPDIAILGLGVEVQQKTVAEAQRQAAEAMSKVMKVLSGRGVADKDIQTTQYNIYPVKRWDDKGQVEILLGYRVSNMVQVKIRKIEDAGGIIDAVASAGGDAIRINSIGFSIDDPTNYYKQAREKAVKDAMDKAKQIASTSGTKLGKVLYITETGAYIPQPIVRNFLKAEAVSAPETPISGGELEILVNIQMVYDID